MHSDGDGTLRHNGGPDSRSNLDSAETAINVTVGIMVPPTVHAALGRPTWTRNPTPRRG